MYFEPMITCYHNDPLISLNPAWVAISGSPKDVYRFQ